MIPGPIVVVKLGGSLLDWPDWPVRLRAVVAERPGTRFVVLVGGGRFADALCALDAAHALGEERSHALALHVLATTAQVAAALLPGSAVAGDVADLPGLWAVGLTPILDPRAFLARDDRALDHLPHRWTTTTDSIAARLADRLGGAGLVLLKSTPLPPDCPDWGAAARLGLVDPEFPRLAAALDRVEFLCLRGAEPTVPATLPAASPPRGSIARLMQVVGVAAVLLALVRISGPLGYAATILVLGVALARRVTSRGRRWTLMAFAASAVVVHLGLLNLLVRRSDAADRLPLLVIVAALAPTYARSAIEWNARPAPVPQGWANALVLALFGADLLALVWGGPAWLESLLR